MRMKLNTLPPTLRETPRYMVFEIISNKEIQLQDFIDALWGSCLALFGEAGSAGFSLWVPQNLYDAAKKRGIVKCTHFSVENVRAALAAIRQISGEPATIHVLGTTGTILSAKKKFLGITDLKDFGRGK